VPVGRAGRARALGLIPSFEDADNNDIFVRFRKLQVVSNSGSEENLADGRIDPDNSVVRIMPFQAYQVGRGGPKGDGLKKEIEQGAYSGIVKTTLDGVNQIDYLTGKSDKSARNVFYYFSGATPSAVRYNN
jgi:hypothetical protein